MGTDISSTTFQCVTQVSDAPVNMGRAGVVAVEGMVNLNNQIQDSVTLCIDGMCAESTPYCCSDGRYHLQR